MKTAQHHEAEQLFFQHNLSKTEIAEKLNVNRRTVSLWAQQGNLDKIRKSSQHMPSPVVRSLPQKKLSVDSVYVRVVRSLRLHYIAHYPD